jgi:acetyltransferase
VLLFTYGAMMAPNVPEGIIGTVQAAVARHGKPVAFCLLSWLDETSRVKKVVDYPVYSTTEEAVRALERSYRHFSRLKPARRVARIPAFELAPAAAQVVAACRARGETLVSYDALVALKAAGVETVPTYLAHDVQQVRTYASGMAFPVVLKVVAAGVAHKSDVGGVAMGIGGALDAAAKAIDMRERVELAVPGAKVEGFMLQETAPAGVEMFIGAGRDPSFGPYVTAGLGGVLVELFRDVAMRPAPLDRETALDMLRTLKGWKLLTGYRGRPACDVKALCEAIVKVGTLIAGEPHILEIDVNPIVVYPEGLGAIAIDARMRLG